jgi:non-heme chloroperoxidase
MSFVSTKDGVEIYYKDWGPKNAQPIVFHHGWPLSSDDWDTQMLFFVGKGYRVVAHDRRTRASSRWPCLPSAPCRPAPPLRASIWTAT